MPLDPRLSQSGCFSLSLSLSLFIALFDGRRDETMKWWRRDRGGELWHPLLCVWPLIAWWSVIMLSGELSPALFYCLFFPGNWDLFVTQAELNCIHCVNGSLIMSIITTVKGRYDYQWRKWLGLTAIFANGTGICIRVVNITSSTFYGGSITTSIRSM